MTEGQLSQATPLCAARAVSIAAEAGRRMGTSAMPLSRS